MDNSTQYSRPKDYISSDIVALEELLSDNVGVHGTELLRGGCAKARCDQLERVRESGKNANIYLQLMDAGSTSQQHLSTQHLGEDAAACPDI